MKILAAILCDAAVSYGAKLCILGAFDAVFAEHFPAQHHHLAIALRILTVDEDAGEHSIQAKLINPDGDCVLEDCGPSMTVMFHPVPETSYFRSYNLVFQINGLPFPSPGPYQFDITLDGESVAQIPIQVILRKRKEP